MRPEPGLPVLRDYSKLNLIGPDSDHDVMEAHWLACHSKSDRTNSLSPRLVDSGPSLAGSPSHRLSTTARSESETHSVSLRGSGGVSGSGWKLVWNHVEGRCTDPDSEPESGWQLEGLAAARRGDARRSESRSKTTCNLNDVPQAATGSATESSGTL